MLALRADPPLLLSHVTGVVCLTSYDVSRDRGFRDTWYSAPRQPWRGRIVSVTLHREGSVTERGVGMGSKVPVARVGPGSVVGR